MKSEKSKQAAVNVDSVWELHPHVVHKLKNQTDKILLLDVREPKEWQYTRIEGAILIPLDQLLRRLEELKLAREKHIVVYCHHGDRSLLAAELLRDSGFTMVHSLSGGIEAWSILVDPAVRRY